jgi:tetratricopeptide (TPR) repeat protein
MFRWLIAFVRRLPSAPRNAVGTVRGWLVDWFHVTLMPFRAIRPGYWLQSLVRGILEILMILRLVRPRKFRTEMFDGGMESVWLVRTIVGGVVATVVGFFWFLLLVPRFLLHWGYHGPIIGWYFLRSRTKWQLAGLTAAAGIVLGGTGGVSAYLIREHRRDFHISLLHRQVDSYLFLNDVNKLEECMAALAAEEPEDPRLGRRLAMVRNREASPAEPDLVRFFMRYHMSNGRVAESVREANKLLESSPQDWEARCYLAKAALARGDREAAKAEVAKLPRAQEVANTIPVHVARDSAYLFSYLGDTSRFDEMVEFVTVNILPDLRGKEMVHLTIPHKLFLIDCYYLALSRLEKRPPLTKYWASLELAFESILTDPAVDTETLVQIGKAGQRENLKWLQVFRAQRLVSPDECDAMARETLERQRRIWQEVLRRDPKRQEAYVGLAELAYTVGSPAVAEQALAQGLKECGPIPELVIAAGKLLRLTDPRRGLAFLERTVQEEEMTLVMCEVFDEVAAQAGRPDKAIDACRRAETLDPKLEWPRLREATHCLKLGRPAEAVIALKPIEARLLKNPDGCASYVRALCETGRDQQADEFLARIAAAGSQTDVLLKTADALQIAGRNVEAVRWADAVLAKDVRNTAAWITKADNLRIQADRGDDGWDIDLSRESINAYRLALQQEPERTVADRAANNIAWLQLKALKMPAEAFESAYRLRAIEDRVDTKAEYLETLGATYIGVHQYDKAVKVLSQAVSTSGARPSFYIYLALAHHGLDHREDAETYLARAAQMPMRPHDKPELREAGRIIHGR